MLEANGSGYHILFKEYATIVSFILNIFNRISIVYTVIVVAHKVNVTDGR